MLDMSRTIRALYVFVDVRLGELKSGCYLIFYFITYLHSYHRQPLAT